MKQITICLCLLLSTSAMAFLNQPKKILAMETLSSKVTLEMSELSNVHLENCADLASSNPNAKIIVGDIVYALSEAYTNNKGGNCVKGIMTRSESNSFLYLIYKELETGTRLTITFNGIRNPKLTFGYGKNKQATKVLTRY